MSDNAGCVWLFAFLLLFLLWSELIEGIVTIIEAFK